MNSGNVDGGGTRGQDGRAPLPQRGAVIKRILSGFNIDGGGGGGGSGGGIRVTSSQPQVENGRAPVPQRGAVFRRILSVGST